jgi:hypothetical protein
VLTDPIFFKTYLCALFILNFEGPPDKVTDNYGGIAFLSNVSNPTSTNNLPLDHLTSDCVGAEDEEFFDSYHKRTVKCRQVCWPAKTSLGSQEYCSANCRSTFSE